MRIIWRSKWGIKLNIKKLLISLIISFICSVLCILFIYLKWDLLFKYPILALELFNKWPWFSGISFITAINFLLPFFYIWFSKGDYVKFAGELMAFSLFITSLGCMLIYPGLETLEMLSDSRAIYAISGIAISQLITLRVVAKEIYYTYKQIQQR